jgi:hypothetical protein
MAWDFSASIHMNEVPNQIPFLISLYTLLPPFLWRIQRKTETQEYNRHFLLGDPRVITGVSCWRIGANDR